MRDHTKLKAFHLVDAFVLKVYRITATFPKHELYGLTAQIRKSAVSSASNLVEGCARHSEADYLRFLDMAYSSSKECAYQLSIAFRLEYLSSDVYYELEKDAIEVAKVLTGLIRSIR